VAPLLRHRNDRLVGHDTGLHGRPDLVIVAIGKLDDFLEDRFFLALRAESSLATRAVGVLVRHVERRKKTFAGTSYRKRDFRSPT
jgi:hypothetical protein